MISKKLQQDIEDTAVAAEVNNELNAIPEEEEVVGLQEQLEQPVETDPAPAIPFAEEPVDEPIQVASLFGLGAKIFKSKSKAEKAAELADVEARVLPPLPDTPVVQTPGGLLVRAASQEDIDLFNEAVGGAYTKGINFPAIAEGIGDLDLADYMAKVKDANKQLFEASRRGTLNFESLKVLAEKQGLDVTVEKWLTRTPGSGDTAEDILAGLIAYQGVSKEAMALSKKINLLEAGPERDLALDQWHKLATLEGVLGANVSGAGSEAGRTLYMLRQAQQNLEIGDIESRSQQLVRLFGSDNVEDIAYMHHLYMGLPDARAKAKFTQQGIASKSMDIIVEIWINSILSSPVTHMINIAGNSMFYLTRMAENTVAAGIGTVRSKITGNLSRVRAREAFIEGQTLIDTFGDALIMAGRTFVTELPQSPGMKIDVRNTRSIGSTGDLTQLMNEGPLQGAVNILGVSIRLPGRFLLAEDEFFKAIGYRAALRKLAYVNGANLYDNLVEGGMDAIEAQKKAAEETANILNNPQNYPDLVGDAQAASKELTFQADLSDSMASLQGAMSHPIAKLIVPFFKTPTNVINETLKRTPIALAYPSVRKAIAAGGRDADIATSKIAMGSMVGGYFAYQAMSMGAAGEQDTIIIGAGPSDPAKRQAFDRQGLYPYTINFRIKEGPDKGKYTSYTYSRLDPISGVLSMGADMANYAMYEDGEQNLQELAMHMGMSTFSYATQMPFLQGVSELATVFRAPNPQAQFEAFLQLSTQKVTEAGLAVVPGSSSFWSGVGRVADPTARSAMLPASGEVLGFSLSDDPAAGGPMTRGFYSALQKMKSRNPMFNDELPPRLNLWNEKMTVGEGSGWEMVSPIRVRTTKFNVLDQELVKLGGGVSMPKGSIKGVRLNADQYNRLIILMNEADFVSESEDGLALMPGDKGYDPQNTMKPELVNFILLDTDYQALGKTDRLDQINNVIQQFRTAARDQLLQEDLYLAAKVSEKDKVK